MDKEGIRLQYNRLLNCKAIEDSLEMLDLISNCQFDFFNANINNEDIKLHHAAIVNQMLFTKAQNLKSITSGISFQGANGLNLNPIIDPTVLASAIRDIFETVCMFHVVYVSPETIDEKLIMYNLWAIAGLNYRQSFSSSVVQYEGLKKLIQEAQLIKELTEQIHNTERYKKLPEKEQTKIANLIKAKDYKAVFDNDTFKMKAWHEIPPLMGAKESIMGKMYTYFSLYAHPSNVAVFQFEQMFNKNDPHGSRMANFNLCNALLLLSFFISDYTKVLPDALHIFENQAALSQIMINAYNSIGRSFKYEINDAKSFLN